MEKRRVLTILGLLFIGIFADADDVSSEGSKILEPEFLPLQKGDPAESELHKRQLSLTEQAQILSDVQQHRARFSRLGEPQQLAAESTAAFPNLAKYKVDRVKQQQQLLQQQAILNQQQKAIQQIGQNYFEAASRNQYQPLSAKQQQQFQNQQEQFGNLYQRPPFNDEQNSQLQSYYEKQRLLEVLQKQRERLLAEQQELRRQQEILRLQQLQHLTTTTTQAPVQTTYSPLLLSSPSARKITPAESDLFLKAIASHQKKYSTSTTASPPISSTTQMTTTAKQQVPKDILSLIEAQESSRSSASISRGGKSKPQIQIIYQTEKPKVDTSRVSAKTKSTLSSPTQREALLKQLKLALIQSPGDDVAKNLTTREIVLPNGKTVQVIQAPNNLPSGGTQLTSESLQEIVRESLPTTSIKPPNAILEELTKGVLPPGADFEVLRHKVDGNLEAVGKSPLENTPAKKVTFVVLEEQADGSYKVQGVKGNADKESGGDVESIVQRIKNGELKLPPPSKKLNETKKAPETTTVGPERARNIDVGKSNSKDYNPFVTVSSSSAERYVTSAATPSSHVYNSFGTTVRPVQHTQSYASVSTKYPTRSQFIPTMAPVNEIVTQYPTTTPLPVTTPEFTTVRFFSPTTYSHFGTRTPAASPSPRSIEDKSPKGNNIGSFESTPLVSAAPESSGDNLIRILKRQGLYAMAKFLGQSGLGTILNDTGPYTIFAPTDKAFRTLLVQLGGPEKAEQKFRESPRLLSGLLLHHVIPGSFRIDSLQDEMTGVSLAGTQLRVNVYSMQDVEWNDVRVTAINGARVLPDKQDIEIPQGIAHAVDRVMFPLPVGDLVQTLQADRERRFSVFLRALHASGLEETLSGSKTFTVFAPTDTAFMIASASPNGSPPWLDDEDNQEAAKAIVSRHVIPSTLYTSGMRYYQQKETLHPQASLHIHKNSGRIKVNNAQVITHNVPATNGVIHAVDSLL